MRAGSGIPGAGMPHMPDMPYAKQHAPKPYTYNWLSASINRVQNQSRNVQWAVKRSLNTFYMRFIKVLSLERAANNNIQVGV